MKITRLTTYWDAEEVITLIGMIDDLKEALLYTYQAEIDQYQQQQWLKQQKRCDDNLDLFDDNMDF
jgi:hypothetical protein